MGSKFISKGRKSMLFASGSGAFSSTTPQVTEAVPFNFQTSVKKTEKISLNYTTKIYNFF